MKKRVLSLVMVLTMVSAALVGCGGSKTDEATDGDKKVIKLGSIYAFTG